MELTPVLDKPAFDLEDDLLHWYCECNEFIGLCGVDLTNAQHGDPELEPICVVCDDLDDLPCPRCGQIVR